MLCRYTDTYVVVHLRSYFKIDFKIKINNKIPSIKFIQSLHVPSLHFFTPHGGLRPNLADFKMLLILEGCIYYYIAYIMHLSLVTVDYYRIIPIKELKIYF